MNDGYQIILTVVAGSTQQPVRVFMNKNPTQPISVGASGEWRIEGHGIEPVHFFLAFDGDQVFVATAGPDVRMAVRGVDVDPSWRSLPVPTEIRFGTACVLVEREEMGNTFGRTLRQGSGSALPNLAPGVGPLRTQIIELPPEARQPTPAPVEPAPAPPAKAPVLGFVPVQPVPRMQAQPSSPSGFAPPPDHLQRTAAMAPRPAAQPAMAPQPAMAHQPPIVPQPAIAPQPAFSPPPAAQATIVQQPGQPAAAHPAGYQPAAPQPLRPAEPDPHGIDQSDFPKPTGPTTMFDGGALRDHALRVASIGSNTASGRAYSDEVRKVVGEPAPLPAGPLINEPPRVPSNPQPGLANLAGNAGFANSPGGSPQLGNPAFANPQFGQPGATPPGQQTSTGPGSAGDKPAGGIAGAWKAASLPRKLTLVLLPFGVAAAVVVPTEPDATPPPQQAKRPVASASVSAKAAYSGAAPNVDSRAAIASANALASAAIASAQAAHPNMAQLAASAAALASSPALASAMAASSGAAAALKDAQQAMLAAAGPLAANAKLAQSAQAAASAQLANVRAATAALSAAVTASSATPGATPATPAGSAEVARAAAQAITARQQVERDAINLAFEGKNAQAAVMYQNLATGEHQQIFALAARLAKAEAVRKPATSR